MSSAISAEFYNRLGGIASARTSAILRSDSVMHSLMVKYGEVHLKQRPPFLALARSIIAQQISTKAADTIRGRLKDQFGAGPERVAAAPASSLRRLGLSEAKACCLRDVALRADAGEFDGFENLPDEVVVARLRTIRGIGPWTSNMFLIFCLARQDVWPTMDAGLSAASRRLYKVETKTALQQLGDRFATVRSLAALYLWKSLENTAVDGVGAPVGGV